MGEKRVWIDIFAVNQHDSIVMMADLGKLAGVIEKVPEGLLLVLEPAEVNPNV